VKLATSNHSDIYLGQAKLDATKQHIDRMRIVLTIVIASPMHADYNHYLIFANSIPDF